MQYFFLTHLVRDDENEAIALLRRDEGQAQAGIAGGRFDESAAWSYLAVALGCFDEREADAILDGARRILVFELGEEAARTSVEARQFDERRVADGIEHAPMHRHDASPCARHCESSVRGGDKRARRG